MSSDRVLKTLLVYELLALALYVGFTLLAASCGETSRDKVYQANSKVWTFEAYGTGGVTCTCQEQSEKVQTIPMPVFVTLTPEAVSR